VKKTKTLKDFRKVSPLCWAFTFYDAYIPKFHDVPLELIDEKNGTWMVVLYHTDKYDCPKGFSELEHYSDDLDCYGKDFNSLENAIKCYIQLYDKYFK